MIHNSGCAEYAPTVNEAIKVGRAFPCSAHFVALDIAKYFQKAGRVYIPKADPFYTSYFGMLGTIWASGYIAGVRAERATRKKRKEKALA